jgi:hypothetical protein
LPARRLDYAVASEAFCETLRKRSNANSGNALPTHDPQPAAVLIHRAGYGRTKRAADEDAGHVQGIQAAAALGVQGIDRALAKDHVHLHAEVQDHAGHCQADHAVGRMDERGQETQAGEQQGQQ